MVDRVWVKRLGPLQHDFIHKDARGNVSILEVFLFGSIGSQMCGQAFVGVNEMEW